MNNASGEKRPLTALLETQNRAKIARKLKVDRGTVARWARGESIPSGDKLLELARLLGIPADCIMVGASV